MRVPLYAFDDDEGEETSFTSIETSIETATRERDTRAETLRGTEEERRRGEDAWLSARRDLVAL